MWITHWNKLSYLLQPPKNQHCSKHSVPLWIWNSLVSKSIIYYEYIQKSPAGESHLKLIKLFEQNCSYSGPSAYCRRIQQIIENQSCTQSKARCHLDSLPRQNNWSSIDDCFRLRKPDCKFQLSGYIQAISLGSNWFYWFRWSNHLVSTTVDSNKYERTNDAIGNFIKTDSRSHQNRFTTTTPNTTSNSTSSTINCCTDHHESSSLWLQLGRPLFRQMKLPRSNIFSNVSRNL